MLQVLPTLFEVNGLNITNVIASQEGSLEDIVGALNYISSLDGTDKQVDIVNMSFGNEGTISSLNEKLCELAKNKVLIAAAGKRAGIFQLFYYIKVETILKSGATSFNSQSLNNCHDRKLWKYQSVYLKGGCSIFFVFVSVFW